MQSRKLLSNLLLAVLLLIPVAAHAQSLYQGTQEARYPIAATVAFGAVDAAYDDELVNVQALRLVIVDNRLNTAVYVSFDGTNNHFHVAAGTVLELKLADIALHESGTVYIKYVTAPASGAVYISGAY